MTLLKSQYIRNTSLHVGVYAHDDRTIALDVMRHEDDGSSIGTRWTLLPEQARGLGEALLAAAHLFELDRVS